MTARQARDLAKEWVLREGVKLPGFCGAFFHGSITTLSDDVAVPPTSDVDVMLVVDGAGPADPLGKFGYRDLLLEVSLIRAEQIGSPEQVLADYPIAGSFRAPGIILDPAGRLAALQAVVAREFAKREWVLRRCGHARDRALNHLRGCDDSRPLHDQVMSWSFGAGVTTHVLLVAGLRNPTVRRRYATVRDLLEEYNMLDFHEVLLDMAGCARMTRVRVEQHLAAVAEAFDAAKTLKKTPYRFSADLTDAARPVAIDGSRELIELGYHREAVFWILATYSRCQWVFHHDATAEIQERFSRGYRDLLAGLGISSAADIRERCGQVRSELPRVWQAAGRIMSENEEIED